MKSNDEMMIESRIVQLSNDHDLTDWNIADQIEAEFGFKVTAEYVAKVIAEYITSMSEETYERENDEGYDPYMNTYTDDC